MPQNLLFLIAIVAILVVNGAVVAAAANRDGRPWRSKPSGGRLRAGSADRPADAIPARPLETNEREPVDDRARTAAAIEAFVAGLDPIARDHVPILGPVPAMDRVPEVMIRPNSNREGGAGEMAPGHGESPPARLGDSATWEHLLGEEAARVARFGRPATIVFVECPGLDRIAERLGAPAADRVAAELARLVLADGRATDRVVRLGVARFGALLIETDEPAALNYVERIRAAGDGWLAGAGLAARLTIGWASPDQGRDLGLAAETARERMVARDSRPSPLGRTRGRQPSEHSGTATTTQI